MAASASQKFHASKAEGVYYRLKADGSKSWYARFTDHNKKRVWSKCGSYELAKARLADVTTTRQKGDVIADPTTTLGELLPKWRTQRDGYNKPSTRETEDRLVRLYIEPRWGRTRVRDIKPNGLVTWINSLKKQNGEPMPASSRSLVLAVTSTLLTFARDEGLIGTNPVSLMPERARPKQKPKVARILRPGELDALVANAPEWLGPIMRLLAVSGLRIGELCGLRWCDVDFENETLTIARQISKGREGTPKSGKPRTVPMMGDASSVLQAQRTVVVKQRLALGLGAITPETPVFTSSTGGPILTGSIQRSFDKARTVLDPDPRLLTLHDFRATVATVLANEPGSVLPQVKEMLGHSDIRITMGYVDPDREAADAWKKSGSAALSSALGVAS